MTFRVSLYDPSQPRRSRRVNRFLGATEGQAARFIGYNQGELGMRFLAVIAPEKSVGQDDPK